MAGPAGVVAGAVAGGVAGGLFGKAAAESLDPTVEDTYWRREHLSRPYYDKSMTYEDYGPAYRYGWESSRSHANRKFDEVETDLGRGWDKARAKSRLGWEKAKFAARDAWDRVNTRKP